MKRVIRAAVDPTAKNFAVEVIIDDHFIGYLSQNSRGRGQCWSYIDDEPTLFTKRSAAMKKSNAGYSDEFIYNAGKRGHAVYRYCSDLADADHMIELGWSPYSHIEMNVVEIN